ncbi:DUF484 family protein [Candidatus Phycosocius spiralis]|uniref:DUF484 family protein n=1 Tax=Candidatus Phycosocius spiralis TaxID=2815099 RepID=A0ABQ4PV57_9PROT|nr:DUF484 family protein [Candidatus Phycosocius spiralis]GIU66815.1 hypothetical protein PsB1_0969 [Candidatus Phycosocius spiralis]
MAYQDATLFAEPGFDLDLVRDFLMQNPGFIRNDAELLTCIASEPSSGNVIAIGDLARERMLRETRSARSRFSAIVETARANYEAQIRVQEAILAVLDSHDPDDLNERLTGHVAFALASDVCILAVSDSDINSQALDKAGSAIERLVPASQPTLLGPIEHTRTWLYGDQAAHLRSEVLARLEFGPNRRLAVLAIASRDIDAFRPEHGGELVMFFARVLERVLSRFASSGLL